MPDEIEYYTKPEHGWTCFHCGETFTTAGMAEDHFGFSPACEPACRVKCGAERGLVMALRKSEQAMFEAWEIIHSESSEIERAMRAQAARHDEQLQTVEELGYERGLRAGLRRRWWAPARTLGADPSEAEELAQLEEDRRDFFGAVVREPPGSSTMRECRVV